MKATRPPEHEALRALLIEAVNEMNDLVPGDEELDRLWNEAQRQTPKLSELDSSTVRDGAEHAGFWRDYFKDERLRYATLFRELAERGRLPKSELQDLIDTDRLGHSRNDYFDVVGGKPQSRTVHKFKSANEKWSYAVLMLAEGSSGYHVISCKQCGKLVLVEPKQMGRPAEFCSPRHAGVYRQQKLRKLRARKHK